MSGGYETKDSMVKYLSLIPGLGDLYNKFGIECSVSWAICRPLIRAAKFSDVKVIANDGNEIENSISTDDQQNLRRFNPTTNEMKNAYLSMISDSVWVYMKAQFFETFFSYSLYDIHCPKDQYKCEIERLLLEVDRLTKLQKGGRDAFGAMASMRASAAAAGATERETREAPSFTKAQCVSFLFSGLVHDGLKKKVVMYKNYQTNEVLHLYHILIMCNYMTNGMEPLSLPI
mmetsp:Transcript_20175/g.28377  ORF Transcript_20175/g.28377 Transcript_20175/m.28377 type:complete len:231 (+) Transcript_20175:981-1673(+)